MQWILDHWHAITAVVGGPVVITWTWISAHHGTIQKVYSWIRQQLDLRAKNVNLTEELATTQQLLSQASARAKQAESERDVLAKRLQPPERRHELEDKLLILASKHGRVTSDTLQRRCGVNKVHSNFYHRQLLEAGLLETTGQPNPFSYLTHAGRAYLIRYNMVPESDAA